MILSSDMRCSTLAQNLPNYIDVFNGVYDYVRVGSQGGPVANTCQHTDPTTDFSPRPHDHIGNRVANYHHTCRFYAQLFSEMPDCIWLRFGKHLIVATHNGSDVFRNAKQGQCRFRGSAIVRRHDGYLNACLDQLAAELGVEPTRMMVVGDTVADMIMGTRAEVGCRVGVLTGVSDSTTLAAPADIIIDSIKDIDVIG